MKSLFGTLLITSFLSVSSQAQTYLCQDTQGNIATLKLNGVNDVTWNETSQSAFSSASYMGLDDAPFSETKNFMLFRLTDFYTTEDSSFVLALKLEKNSAKAVVYFDNDGHSEQENQFNCIKN